MTAEAGSTREGSEQEHEQNDDDDRHAEQPSNNGHDFLLVG